MEKAESEQLLLSEAVEAADSGADYILKANSRRSKSLIVSLSLNLLMLAVILVMGAAPIHLQNSAASQEVYCMSVPWSSLSLTDAAPAQDAIEYRTEVFHGGLHGERSEYMGSTEGVDRNWEALYNKIGISQINEVSARKLPIATTPLSYDSSQYLVQLDVFHEIHCLNLLRKTLYPETYPQGQDAEDFEHLEHCIESIRQSLQCSSDISTISWEWSNQRQRVLGNLRAIHTCRNFEKIQAWAREHSLKDQMDMYHYVPGAPLKQE